MCLYSSTAYSSSMSRYYGCSIRPVYDNSIPTLTLSSYSESVMCLSSSEYIDVFYDNVLLKGNNITVTSDQSWATATWNPNGYVEVEFTENTGENSRSAIITITYNNISVTYTLYQSSFDFCIYNSDGKDTYDDKT